MMKPSRYWQDDATPEYTETPRMSWAEWDQYRKTIGIRNLETHPIRQVKTPAQRFKQFCAELDRANGRLSVEDAELLRRLEAMPVPGWARAMQLYRDHAQRMREWFKELDKGSRPLTWHPISAERAELLANECMNCDRYEKTGEPCTFSDHKRAWPQRRRDEVMRVAAARGDSFVQFPQMELNAER